MATDLADSSEDLPDDPTPQRVLASEDWEARVTMLDGSTVTIRPDGDFDQVDTPPEGGAEAGISDDGRRQYRDELAQVLDRADPVPVADVSGPEVPDNGETDAPPWPDPAVLSALGAVGAREIWRRRGGRGGQAGDE